MSDAEFNVAVEKDKLKRRNYFLQFPKEWVAPYKPDGADHSFGCDPKYGLLIKFASIYHPYHSVGLNNGLIQKHFKSSENRNWEEFRVKELVEDWSKHHLHQFRMNNMTEEEYTQVHLKPYENYQNARDEVRDAENRKKAKEWDDYVKRFGKAPDVQPESSQGPYEPKEFDRDQVISEYGW
jgi:hypothetical protein